jgi:predicted Zn finger-like uncharacterized protein
MSIRIVCPNCRTAYNAADDQRGRRVRCKQCQAIFLASAGPVPLPGPTEEASVVPAISPIALAAGNPGPEPVAGRSATTANAPKRPAASSHETRPRTKKVPRKIPLLALFLILGGVGGSLFIVAASVVLCIWLWRYPLDTWQTAKAPHSLMLVPRHRPFALPAPGIPGKDLGDAGGPDLTPPDADAPPRDPPPPPKEPAHSVPLPLERKAVPLVFRHQVSSRPLVLDSWLAFKFLGRDGAAHTFTANSETSLIEMIEAVDAQELACVRLQYLSFTEKLSSDSQSVGHPDLLHARQYIKRLAAHLRVDQQGNVVGNEVDWSQIPDAESRPVLAHIHEQFEQALESLAVPLPNRQVSPGESWTAQRTVAIPLFDQSKPLQLDMSYRYAGSRKRDRHEEAVVELKGKMRARNGQVGPGRSRATGSANVDLESGQVTEADLVLLFDVELNAAFAPLSASGKLTLRLRRDVEASK